MASPQALAPPLAPRQTEADRPVWAGVEPWLGLLLQESGCPAHGLFAWRRLSSNKT